MNERKLCEIELDAKTAGDNIAKLKRIARVDVPVLVAEIKLLRKVNETQAALAKRLQDALTDIADIEDWDYGLQHAKDITFKTIQQPGGWDINWY